MKNTHHYSNITFSALLVSVVIMGLSNKDMGVMGVVLVCVGWATTRIVKDGISSLIYLMTRDDEEQ